MAVPDRIDLHVRCVNGVLRQGEDIVQRSAVDDHGISIVIRCAFAGCGSADVSGAFNGQVIFDDQAVHALARNIVDDDGVISAQQLDLHGADATLNGGTAGVVSVTDDNRPFGQPRGVGLG